ncbi:MAG: tRNA pseudouridine(38-40) synthase TruA [Oscillospiraceae bacterium]
MRNLLVELRYNGARYHGYQIQKNAITITEVVQDAIESLLHAREPIVGCSRTDSKVHANSYFFNMKTEFKIPTHKFVYIMNNALPSDICVLSCKEVPLDFHSRYDCKGKEYIYRIYNATIKDPFQADLALLHKTHIDEKLLNDAAQVLVGMHDFTSFCSLGFKPGTPMTKTVEYINIYREGDFVYIKIKADGFLYNMVRIIVGTLLSINDGKIKPESLIDIMEKKDRTVAGKTAEPQGLYLNFIEY